MDERFRDALRRNALLSEVLAEGSRPSADAALRARLLEELARVRRRRAGVAFAAALAAAALLAFAWLGRAPVPAPAPPVVPTSAAPPSLMDVVSTAATDPRMEIVRTESSSLMVVVRTEASFDLARDEDLLESPRVLAIVGHPGAPKRLFVAP